MRRELLLIAAALFCNAAAFGTTITYNATGNATGNGELENASATFVTNLNSITVTLNNNLANPHDAGQLFTDITFTLAPYVSTGSSSLTSSSGTELTVTSTSVGGYSVGTSAATGWDFSNSGSSFTLDLLSSSEAPQHGIIGPSSNGTYSGGAYSNANSSLLKGHNPFLTSGTTFVINVPGLTSAATVTGATFSFGTTPGNTLPGIVEIPEPATSALLIISTAAAFKRVRRRFPTAS
ncbi:MAG: PEP-CTERM sorting domain-containing protein [Verrucomicrobia bacterium]|nr:PEP-CTERM sorting domain-containing protein [Verrucomicrobiota bacterium]